MPLIINQERIPDSALDRELLRLSAGLEADAPHAAGIDPATLRSVALRNIVERSLLLQAANARNISVTQVEVQEELTRRWRVERSALCDPGAAESITQDLLLERITADLTRHVSKPGYAEAEKFYRSNAYLYKQPEAVEAAQIFQGFNHPCEEEVTRKQMEDAEEQLRKGKSFRQVADRFSTCKGVGGSVGWVTRGQMVQEFEDIVFALQPGRYSAIFRTIFGFHIAFVSRRRVAGLIPFQEVRASIVKQMFAQAQRSKLQEILADMRTASCIQYVEGASNG